MLEGYFHIPRQFLDGPLRIGVILPFSGNMAREGFEVYDGYNAARQLINECGGVNGRKVVFVKEDAPDPITAQSAALKMMARNVPVVIGSLANHLGLAASAVVERGGGTYIETTAVSEEFTSRDFKHVFRASTPGAQMGAMAIHFAAKHLASRLNVDPRSFTVGIVYEPNWRLIGLAAKETARSYGMKVGVFQDYDAQALDYSSLIGRLKSAKVNLLLAGGWLNDSVMLNRQARQLGFHPKAWIGLSGGHSIKDYAENLGMDSDGVYVVNTSSNVADIGLTSQGRVLKESFLGIWATHHNKPPEGLACEAFSNAWVLMHDVLPRARSLNPEDIRKAILNLDLPEGALPNGSGAKFSENGANEKAFYTIKQWQGGSMATVWGAVYRIS